MTKYRAALGFILGAAAGAIAATTVMPWNVPVLAAIGALVCFALDSKGEGVDLL